MYLHKIIATTLLIFAGAAYAQTPGFFEAGKPLPAAQLNATFQSKQDFPNPASIISGVPAAGNIPVATGPLAAVWESFSLGIDASIGSIRGSILERGSTGWTIIPPGTSGLPWVSNGAGVDPGYQVIPGIDFNLLNTQVANYSIATTDCGKIIQAGTGATGFFTITLPVIAGFASNCTVTIKNSDTGRGKALSGFPSDLQTILWPLQSLTVKIINGAWQTTVNPGRWKIPGDITFNLDNVNGSNASDGLGTGTGALATFATFNALVSTGIDTNQKLVIATLTASQTWSNISINTIPVGGGTIGLNLSGNTVTSSTSGVAAVSVIVGASAGAFGNTAFEIQNGTITCSGGGNGLSILAGYAQIFSGMTFGSCPGGSHIQVDSPLSRLLLQAGYTISGGAQFHMVAIGGGLIDYNSASFTVTLTGTPAFGSAFAFAEIGGNLVSFNVWSGAATGTRYVANTGGMIFTNNSGANFFPGNVPGTLATGGLYDTEWLSFTPTFTCGTATITNNSARWRSFGKTTAIQIEFTITALGTCTNTLTFTLPATANSAGTIPTIETATLGELGMCRVSPGSATGSCFTTSSTGAPLASFLVNQHFVGSGVYENQ